MGKKAAIAVLSCVFALCLALVGCGGGGGSAANAKDAFVGTWDLVEMEQNGEITGQDDLETLKSLGLEVYVNLNEDATAALVLFGEPIEGTWEASSATSGTITLEGQEVSMTIADGKLKFEQEGAALTFEKGEAKETPAVSDDTATEDEDDEALADEEAIDEEEAAADEEALADEEAAAEEDEAAEGEADTADESASDESAAE